MRIGSAAITTRGMKEADMKKVVFYIDEVLKNKDDDKKKKEIKEEINKWMKDYPLFKWANDTVTRYIKKAEIDANRLLYDTQYVPREHGKILRRLKAGEPFEDYIARNESALDAIGATITARRAFLTQKSYGAALTRFEILMNKEPAKAKQIADVFIQVEANKMAEARANGEKLNTQNQDGTYK